VVVTADHVVTLPADTIMAYDFLSSTEGLLVTTHAYGFTGGGPDPDQALYLVRPDGKLTRLRKGPFDGVAVDPTGKNYAIAEIGLPSRRPVQRQLGPELMCDSLGSEWTVSPDGRRAVVGSTVLDLGPS
jgi:hypothetical protein